MTLSHFIGGKVVGDSTDFATLSTNYPELSTFINTDDFKEYILVAGVWEQVGATPIPTLGGFKEVSRFTIGAPANEMTAIDIPDKRFYQVLINVLGRNSATTNDNIRLGNTTIDTGANYARRSNANNTGDGEAGGLTSVLSTLSTVSNKFEVHYLENIPTEEKLATSFMIQNVTLGGAGVPQRNDLWYKWSNITQSIERFQYTPLSADLFNAGCEVVVLGSDPADDNTAGFWEELASIQGDGTTAISASIPARKYLWVQGFVEDTQSLAMRFNGDSGANYARRFSISGGSDNATGGSQTGIGLNANTTSIFFNTFIVNNQSTEKLVIHHDVERLTAGAATAPDRFEVYAKWANASSFITSIDLSKATNFSTDSFFKVWGSD